MPDGIHINSVPSSHPLASNEDTCGHGRQPGPVGEPGPSGMTGITPEKREGQPFAQRFTLGAPSFQRAYLRPLQRPLFDTEYFVPTKGIKFLPFFKNACFDFGLNGEIGVPSYEYLNEKKTRNDTNLNQSRMLDCPLEHSVLGFRVRIDPKASTEDRNNLLSNGALFTFEMGHRHYLELPLEDVVSRRDSELRAISDSIHREFMAVEKYKNPDESIDDYEQRIVSAATGIYAKQSCGNYYPFNLGKSAIKIKPDENFGCHISWKKTPLVLRPITFITEIVGLLWTPL